MIIDRSLQSAEVEKLHEERKALGLRMCDVHEMAIRCEESMWKSPEMTHDDVACYSDDWMEARFHALQSYLEDTIEELTREREAVEIAEYAIDLSDATGRHWPEEDGMYADEYEDEEAEYAAA